MFFQCELNPHNSYLTSLKYGCFNMFPAKSNREPILYVSKNLVKSTLRRHNTLKGGKPNQDGLLFGVGLGKWIKSQDSNLFLKKIIYFFFFNEIL